MWVSVQVARPPEGALEQHRRQRLAAAQHRVGSVVTTGQHDDLGAVRCHLRAALPVPGCRERPGDVHPRGLRLRHPSSSAADLDRTRTAMSTNVIRTDTSDRDVGCPRSAGNASANCGPTVVAYHVQRDIAESGGGSQHRLGGLPAGRGGEGQPVVRRRSIASARCRCAGSTAERSKSWLLR